jgi:membrane protein DedA with SNARE-associated domain
MHRFKLSLIAVFVCTILFSASFLPHPVSALAPENQASEPASESHRHRLAQDLEHAITRVMPWLEHYGYAAVFVTIMVEGVGMIAPGQTMLIAAALTASHGRLSIVWVLLAACLAAVLGNSLGYLLGRLCGRPLLVKLKVSEPRLARLEGYFSRYGRGVILAARFFDGLRQLNGIVAGVLRMDWGVFTVFNVLGAMLWTGVWGVGTYVLGKEISLYHSTFHKIKPWVATATIILVLVFLVYLFRRRRTAKSE